VALPYYFLIGLIGLFLGGAYNLIGSAVAVDLSKQDELIGFKSATTTISSVLNGFGAFGAACI